MSSYLKVKTAHTCEYLHPYYWFMDMALLEVKTRDVLDTNSGIRYRAP